MTSSSEITAFSGSPLLVPCFAQFMKSLRPRAPSSSAGNVFCQALSFSRNWGLSVDERIPSPALATTNADMRFARSRSSMAACMWVSEPARTSILICCSSGGVSAIGGFERVAVANGRVVAAAPAPGKLAPISVPYVAGCARRVTKFDDQARVASQDYSRRRNYFSCGGGGTPSIRTMLSRDVLTCRPPLPPPT